MSTVAKVAVVVIIVIVAALGGAFYYQSTRVTPTSVTSTSGTPEKDLYFTALGAHWALEPYGPDPVFSNGILNQFNILIYETLFAYNPNSLQQGKYEVVPWVAQSYTVSPDGLEYNLQIRHGIKFHHTGDEMKAADVVYSLNRLLFFTDYPAAINNTMQRMVSSIKSVSVVDDYTLKLTLSYQDRIILEELSQDDVMIVEQSVVEGHAVKTGGTNDHGYQWLYVQCNEAGSGPYEIANPSTDFIPMQRYLLTKYNDYWGGPAELNIPKVKFDKVFLVPVNEDVDSRMKLMRGDIDILQDITPAAFTALSNQPGIKTWSGGGTAYMGLWMHVFQGPLKDWRVRLAIKEAINYTTFAHDIMLGTGDVAQGGFLPGVPGYSNEVARYFPDANVTGANALLDQAGYPVGSDGFRFHINMLIRPSPRYGMEFAPMGLALREQLAKVGIDAVIVVLNVGEYYEQIFDPRCTSLMWVQPDSAMFMTEPGWTYWPAITSTGGMGASSYFGWNVTSQDGLATQFWNMYQAIEAQADKNTRIQMWIQLDRFMLTYGWGVTLTTSRIRLAYSSSITGYFSFDEYIYPAIFYMDKTTSAALTTSGIISSQFQDVNYVTQPQTIMSSWMQLDWFLKPELAAAPTTTSFIDRTFPFFSAVF